MTQKIKIAHNGPYLVSGRVPLEVDLVSLNKDGIPLKTIKEKSFPDQENYHLCRCSHSKNKPFCDDSHEYFPFDGTENPQAKDSYNKHTEITNGPDLILKDCKHLCAGAGFCQRAGKVWNLTKNSNDPESKKIALEEACSCPSGRLVACEKNSGQPIEPSLEPSIGVYEDGPLFVKGGIPIESTDGTTYEIRHRVTLCCCGRSKNKPFCDTSHQEDTKGKKSKFPRCKDGKFI